MGWVEVAMTCHEAALTASLPIIASPPRTASCLQRRWCWVRGGGAQHDPGATRSSSQPRRPWPLRQSVGELGGSNQNGGLLSLSRNCGAPISVTANLRRDFGQRL